MRLRRLLSIAVAVTTLIPTLPAFASLGGDMASVRDDEAKMQASLQTTHKDSYDVHEMQAANGATIREYVSPSGKVFGVAWQGRKHPDLRQVLGAYYDPYIQAVQAQRAQHHGHGPVVIQEPGFTVQMGGHMGALFGRAYLPQNMPAGMRAEEIR